MVAVISLAIYLLIIYTLISLAANSKHFKYALSITLGLSAWLAASFYFAQYEEIKIGEPLPIETRSLDGISFQYVWDGSNSINLTKTNQVIYPEGTKIQRTYIASTWSLCIYHMSDPVKYKPVFKEANN